MPPDKIQQHTVHELKCWPEAFGAMYSDKKNFEFRKNDRGFNVGDLLHLREWVPLDQVGFGGGLCRCCPPQGSGEYTGREMFVRVTWILREGFGLPEGYIIMSTEYVSPQLARTLEFGEMD